VIGALLAAAAIAAAPAAADDAVEAELRAAREDRAKIVAHIGKIEAFRASLSLPKDAAADARAGQALQTSRDALAKADARLRAAERRNEDGRSASAAYVRAAHCAVAPLLDLLREHGPDAAELGADVRRELEAALGGPQRTLAPTEHDVVTVFRDLQRSSGKREVQAVVKALVTRSGETGDVRVDVQYAVGDPQRGGDEGQILLVLDAAGRLKDGQMPRRVRSCVDR
jgi:hypothetical protein